jgi:hypothetical protein
MLVAAATALRPILPEVVFVGGHVAELLVTDEAAPRIRQTDDVDVIVKVTTYPQYRELGMRLEALGFVPDTSPGSPACRWLTPDHLHGRTKVDVMPTAATMIGPSNPWYDIGIATAATFALSPELQIRILSAPAFLATKWAAFENRGNDDALMSQDVEDIIRVVAGRASLLDEMHAADTELRTYVGRCTGAFLSLSDAEIVIEDALPDARLIPAQIVRAKARLVELARLS